MTLMIVVDVCFKSFNKLPLMSNNLNPTNNNNSKTSSDLPADYNCWTHLKRMFQI